MHNTFCAHMTFFVQFVDRIVRSDGLYNAWVKPYKMTGKMLHCWHCPSIMLLIIKINQHKIILETCSAA